MSTLTSTKQEIEAEVNKYSRSTGNHTELQSQVGIIIHLSFRTSDHELITNFEFSYMSWNVSSRVCLQESETTIVSVGRSCRQKEETRSGEHWAYQSVYKKAAWREEIHTLISRSKWPLSSSDDVGVYERMICLPPISACTEICCPMGSPSVASGVGRAKRYL